jgi:hypothetical protein
LAALTTGFSPAEDGVGVSVSLMVEARRIGSRVLRRQKGRAAGVEDGRRKEPYGRTDSRHTKEEGGCREMAQPAVQELQQSNYPPRKIRDGRWRGERGERGYSQRRKAGHEL